MSRIGMIREVITQFGGRPNFTYYADGPRSSMGPSHGKGGRTDRCVSYKIDKFSDGLSDEMRKRALPVLARIPGVERVYLTRSNNVVGFNKALGGHIKIIFADIAKNVNEKSMTLPVDFFTRKSDDVLVPTAKAPEMNTSENMFKNFVRLFGNDVAARELAKSFAENMVEAAALMCEDEPTVEIPNAAGIKTMTVDYAKDILADFENTVLEEIEKLFTNPDVKVNIEAKREVKITLNF